MRRSRVRVARLALWVLSLSGAIFSVGPCGELAERAAINGFFDAFNERLANVLGVGGVNGLLLP